MNDLRLERLLDDVLAGIATEHVPDQLDREIVLATGRVRQRPRWLALLKESPMRLDARVAVGSPTFRLASILALTLALVVATAGAVAVAASLLPSTPPVPGFRNGLIAFSSNGDIWVTDVDDLARQQLTTGPSWDSSPTWSPEGDRIAYWTQRTPAAPFALMVMDADGSHPRKVRDLVADRLGLTDDVSMAWSPDGAVISYSVNDGTTDWIETADVGSGQHVRLAAGKAEVWSPDGSMLAYQGGPTQGEVWTMAANGTSAHQLVSGSGPVWSSADRLAYFAAQGGANDIWVINPDGTGATNITNTAEDEFWPSWSPDGSRLASYRATDRSLLNQVIVTSADGSNQVTLQGELVAGGDLVWSPDGSRVLGALFDEQQGEYGLEVFDATGTGAARAIPADGHVCCDSWQALAP